MVVKKFENLSDLAKANIVWIITFILFMLGLYLDGRYQTKVEAEVMQTELDALKQKVNDFILSETIHKAYHEGEISTINRRLDTKIGIQNKVIQSVDVNENELIRHDAQMELILQLLNAWGSDSKTR